MTRFLSVLALLVALPIAAAAQSATLSGVVVNARTEEPIVDATVTVDGLQIRALSGADGRFELRVPPGHHSVTVSVVGYAVVQRMVDLADGASVHQTYRLAEGAGAFEEHVSVGGSTGIGTPAGASVHGRELEALRGVTLDDPVRALHALPSASSTDDFYSEFAVRGSPFRQIGLSVDGVPTRHLMHSVHGASDAGSIAMINTDVLGALTLMPGSYPQRTGNSVGAHAEFLMREGDRERIRARIGASGTSATLLAEGPIAAGRGSWLVSARRSYIDWLLDRIDDEGLFAFGFADVASKVVLDLNARHQVQLLVITGISRFDDEPENARSNELAESDGRAWLWSAAWRYTPSASFSVTQRLYGNGLAYRTRNGVRTVLDDSHTAEIAWRADTTSALTGSVLFEAGVDARRMSGMHQRARVFDGAVEPMPVSNFRENGYAASAYGRLVLQPLPRVTFSPGARFDVWGPTRATTTSPWANLDVILTPSTTLRAGGGVYRQFPTLQHLFGPMAGGRSLRPESARHADVSLVRQFPNRVTLQASLFARDERDGLRALDAETRRLEDGTVKIGRADAPWTNTLDGRARGVELLVRRDADSGLSGWLGYAFGRYRQTDTLTGEVFRADQDQRHTLSMFGQYRLSTRTSLGATFRYGSNYPITGYVAEQDIAPGTPPLFGGGRPVFYAIGHERNALALPAYARLDVRADRTLMLGRRRLRLFAEIANVLNRRNLRTVPSNVDATGRMDNPTASLLPFVPSVGFVIEL